MTWSLTNRGGAAAAASAVVAASPNATYQARLRSVQVTLSGTAAGTATVVIRDGAPGVGAILFEADLFTAANAKDQLSIGAMDLRASAGNALTVEFIAGTASDFQCVNAQGDYVPPGFPYGI